MLLFFQGSCSKVICHLKSVMNSTSATDYEVLWKQCLWRTVRNVHATFFFTTTTRVFPTTVIGGPVTISLRSLFLSVSFVYPSTTMGTIPSTSRHWQRMYYEPAWTRTLTVHTRSRQYETAMHILWPKGTMVDTGRIPQYVQGLWLFFYSETLQSLLYCPADLPSGIVYKMKYGQIKNIYIYIYIYIYI